MKQSAPMTFMGHVHELRRRFFWVALWFVGVSCATLPFFDSVIKLLMRPLGNEKLYYLTPVGGLGFMIKVSMYLGLIATLPILLYHLYGFVSPAVMRHRKKARFVLLGVAASFLLAVIGIVFAYVVSLPSAIHFLTNINISGVSPMLTVDSYLSFIIAYLLAGALLFQLPLIMVIVDSIKPTPPKQWGKYERHMIVASFVIAMLITPTPNIIDQISIAAPMIVMYQIGIVIIYFRHPRRRQKPVVMAKQPQPAAKTHVPVAALPVKAKTPAPVTTLASVVSPVKPAPTPLRKRPQSMEFMPRSIVRVPTPRSQPTIPVRQTLRRSIDGISMV